MKSKELKKYNLPDNRIYNDMIEAKPINILLMLIIFGFISLLLKLYVSGICLIAIGFVCLIILPNRRLIEFYDDHLIMYNKARKDECNILYYDEIKNWNYKTNISMDKLTFILEDGSSQKIDAFSKGEFEKLLNKYLADKKIVDLADKKIVEQ